jgi:hypothetical protein
MIPLTGTLTGAALRAELGLGSGAIASLLAVDGLRRLTNQPTGPVTLSAARGTALLRASAEQQAATILCGSPAAAGAYRLVIEPGVVVGSTSSAVAALDTGQFPSGSTLAIDVYGKVLGAAGPAGSGGAGGAGGAAIKANYAGQTVTVRYKAGGEIRAGGGGGGKGGAGGTGGTGGQGYYNTSSTEGPAYAAGSYEVEHVQGSGTWTFRWGGGIVGTSGGTSFTSGPYTYTTGGLVTTTSVGSGETGDQVFTDHYQVYRTTAGTVITNGGGGGSGGAGGSGGQGQGYNRQSAAQFGFAGSLGNGGAGGGTNAGTGGTGGQGGSGGGGGAWGVGGSGGATGFAGATGNSGNYSAGSAGSAGSGGFSGGAAGNAVIKGSASVTVINDGGTISGPVS